MPKLISDPARKRPSRVVPFQPEYGDYSDLRIVFGLRKSFAYKRVLSGDFKTVEIREAGKARGKRLINFDSVRRFLAKHQGTDPGNFTRK
jgi:hypothetical protein